MSSHQRARRAPDSATTTAGPVTPTRRRLQARLEVGAVDDPMEAEAEATADRVLSTIQAGGGAPAVAAAARAVEEEELAQGYRVARAGKDEEELLQGYRVARADLPRDEEGGGPAAASSGGGAPALTPAPSGGATPATTEAPATSSGAPAQAPAAASGGPAAATVGGGPDEEKVQGFRRTPVNDDAALEKEADAMGAAAAPSGPAAPRPRTNRAVGPDEEEPLQGSRVARAGIGPEGGAVDPELEARLTAGGGSPLPEPVKASMEAAFGADFSAVRISENPAAAEIGALAYTTGADVRFAPGRFQPGSSAGQHLLAHELTHVVQQGAAPAAAGGAQRKVDIGSLTVDQVLANHRELYRDYLTRAYAVENLNFLESVERHWPVDMVIDTYLSDDAPQQINVSDAERRPIMEGKAYPDVLKPAIIKLLGQNLAGFKSDPKVVAALSA